MTRSFTESFLNWLSDNEYIEDYTKEEEFNRSWFRDGGEWFPIDILIDSKAGRRYMVEYLEGDYWS